jgi:aspartate/methionine/tyrosine aminotransferase
MQQNLFISASRFVQHAGIAALEEGGDTVAAMREEYEIRRRLLAEGVSAFHFYTLNQAPLCTAVCRMLGAQPAIEEAA